MNDNRLHILGGSVSKWALFCLIVLGAGSHKALAQLQTQALDVRRSNITGMASFITAVDGGPIEVQSAARGAIAQPIDFFIQHGHLFGLADPRRELVISRAETDALGHTCTTFSQVHDGLKVFSGVLKVHQDATGRFLAANGDFYPISAKLDTQPRLDADAAALIAKQAIDGIDPTVITTDLVIVDPGWYGDPPIGAHLAYHIIIRDSAAGLMEAFFIDAHSGRILDRWNLIERVIDRRIHDAAGGLSLPGAIARIEGDNPTGDADVDATYDYLGDTYDYFLRAFGRDGIDDHGMTMIVTTDTGAVPCPNAFWDGSQMAFCDRTVSDDVVAHELTHGITQFTADLIYQNQSGQLNESYSDVFGEMVDLFNGDAAFAGPPGGTPWPTHPTGPGTDTPNSLRTICSFNPTYSDGVRWLMGEDVSVFGGAIRDMWSPTCMGDPDSANDPRQTCNPNDNGGVHSGSGIPNHAFAMLVDGKTFNGFTINPIGPIKAGAVWYRALTVYLTPASDFQEAFLAFNFAALDLIGSFPNDPRTGVPSDNIFTSFDADQVVKALRAVEMDTAGSCGGALKDIVLLSEEAVRCQNGIVLFEDDFENGPNGWTLTNSMPATPYDWVQLSGLPFGRSGTAWFIEDRQGSACGFVDESGTHSLMSPLIQLPTPMDFPLLSFTHLVLTEAGWDGGNISLRINGGQWQFVPRSAYVFNPYNARLNTALQENTNPMAGQEAWSGTSRIWGTSIVDLNDFVTGGDTLEVRFDFGKDCTGVVEGWFVDDFIVFTCSDCNANGVPDYRDVTFTSSSLILHALGFDAPQSFTIPAPPPAASDVKIFFTASADLAPSQLAPAWVDVDINGTRVGAVFKNDALDCPSINAITPDSETLTVPLFFFNDAISAGDAVIQLTPTRDVQAAKCGGSFIGVFVEYTVDDVEDCNHNLIPDQCEPDCNNNQIADDCETDSDADSVIDDCDVCPGFNDFEDADADGVPDGCDLCPGVDDRLDSDNDGIPDCRDNCPQTSNPDQVDLNDDGVGDACQDCNGNGLLDEDDILTGRSTDCNSNGIPDECEPDRLSANVVSESIMKAGQRIRMGDDPVASGGTPPYAYRWTLRGNPDGEISNEANPMYGPLPAGIYVSKLVVTDANGCIDTAFVRVNVENAPAALQMAPPSEGCGNGFFGLANSLTILAMFFGCFTLRVRRRKSSRHQPLPRSRPPV